MTATSNDDKGGALKMQEFANFNAHRNYAPSSFIAMKRGYFVLELTE